MTVCMLTFFYTHPHGGGENKTKRNKKRTKDEIKLARGICYVASNSGPKAGWIQGFRAKMVTTLNGYISCLADLV